MCLGPNEGITDVVDGQLIDHRLLGTLEALSDCVAASRYPRND
jgi:hypothetical protein